MKMFSKDGVEMVEVKSVARDGDILVLKTKVMGSMAATIVLRPKDVWEALGLLNLALLLRLPLILFKGWRQARVDLPTGTAKPS
jgi:hypothetical protein